MADSLKGVRSRHAVLTWALVGLAACVAMPWGSAVPSMPIGYFAALIAPLETSSAVARAVLHGDLSMALISGGACLNVLLALAALQSRRLKLPMLLCGAATFLVVVFSFFSESHRAAGAGAIVCAVALIFSIGFSVETGRAPARKDFPTGVTIFLTIVLALCVLYPLIYALSKALIPNVQPLLGETIGRWSGDRIWGTECVRGGQCGVVWNTFLLASVTAASTTGAGLVLALCEQRSGSRLARWVRMLAPFPMVIPTFIGALALILLLGRSGLVSQVVNALTGQDIGRWLYGWWGLALSQLFAFTPIAYLIMRDALINVNQVYEDEARTLAASPTRTFFLITLPLLRPAIWQAMFTGFLESAADFGSALVIGGPYPVLATEIFFAGVGGQADQGRAAALACILAGTVILMALLKRVVVPDVHATQEAVTSVRHARCPLPRPVLLCVTTFSAFWLILSAALYVCAFAAAFVEVWGWNYRLTTRHFESVFAVAWTNGPEWKGLGWNSLGNSLVFAACATAIAAFLSILLAWARRHDSLPQFGPLRVLVFVALALPGTVLGFSYALAFGTPPLLIQSSYLLMVLCLVFRSLPVGLLISSSAMEKIPHGQDEASAGLHSTKWRTLTGIILPQMKPAIIGALAHGFVRSITTVSAVTFIVNAENEVATTYILGRVGQGDFGLAFAYSGVLLLFLTTAWVFIASMTGGRFNALAVRGAA